MEKHLVETGNRRSVIYFCEECWKAVENIPHISHHQLSFMCEIFLKSQITSMRGKISAGRLRAEVFCLLSAFWTPRHMPLSTGLETGRAGLATNHLLRELKMGLWLSAILMVLQRHFLLDGDEKAKKLLRKLVHYQPARITMLSSVWWKLSHIMRTIYSLPNLCLSIKFVSAPTFTTSWN